MILALGTIYIALCNSKILVGTFIMEPQKISDKLLS